MTDKEKIEKIKKLADAMYYAAGNLGPNVGSGERLRKTMKEYHQFIIHEYHKEDPKSKFEQSIQEGDNIVYNEDLGCRVNLSQLDRVAKKDTRYCMYSTANYTNGDRLTLCKDCKELCRYNQKNAAESLCISQKTYDEIVDKCLYGSEVELVDDEDLPKEEPVSEIDFEQESLSNKTKKAIDELASNIAEELRKQLKDNLKEESVSDKLGGINNALIQDKCVQEHLVCNDLEDEITRYCNPIVNELSDALNKHQKYVFDLGVVARHFADWQKQQDKQWLAEEHKHIFAKGRDSMKEQMMKEAVKGTAKFVGEGTDKMVKFVCGDLNPDDYELNQRVKLLIIKED